MSSSNAAKRLMIFGGTGFVGSAIAREAARRGLLVQCVTRGGDAPAHLGEGHDLLVRQGGGGVEHRSHVEPEPQRVVGVLGPRPAGRRRGIVRRRPVVGSVAGWALICSWHEYAASSTEVGNGGGVPTSCSAASRWLRSGHTWAGDTWPSCESNDSVAAAAADAFLRSARRAALLVRRIKDPKKSEAVQRPHSIPLPSMIIPPACSSSSWVRP